MAKRGRPRTKTVTKRRSRFSRVRRVARRTRTRLVRIGKKRGKSIITVITGVIPAVASVQLLSFNQLEELGANASTGDKLKTISNGVTGSIFDFNLFNDVPKAHLHFDIEGAFNTWSAIGAGSWIAGIVGQRFGLPRSSLLKSFGKKLIIPAVIAGALGLKNNNPSGGGRNSPFLSQSSHNTVQQTFHNPIIISNGGGSA